MVGEDHPVLVRYIYYPIAGVIVELLHIEGTKRSVYLRENPKMVEEPRIEIVR